MAKKNYFYYKKYAMRSSDYDLMLRDQNGGCAICGTKPGKGKRLDIDHDHTTGEVRSLLCNHCNLLIGHAYDNPEILRSAADYLENGGHPSRFYVGGGKLLPIENPFGANSS